MAESRVMIFCLRLNVHHSVKYTQRQTY